MSLGFYTRGPVSLPHPPYPKATLRLIEAAVAEAWRIIRDHPEGDIDIANADEPRITRELRTCLVNQVLDGPTVPGFTSKIFKISPGGVFESFNGTHLEKRPDLYIDIERESNAYVWRSVDGLFVECKPVDSDHPAGGAYCDKGIIRFVEGEYAWALSQALMIGYASTGYTLPTKLNDALASRTAEMKTTENAKQCLESSASGYCQHPHITVHERDFIYPSTKKKAPPITLRHLWLNRF
jgi:hypothetical protein